MTHATIRFQYDTARFELYLDKLTGLPAPNIRKLFKLMLSEPWNNQTAIDAVEAEFAEKIGSFVVKPLGKPTLALATDKRETYSPAASDFAGVVSEQ